MKLAKIIPLFKEGNRCDPGNYRPISILSVASKMLERIVYKQMNEYLRIESLYIFLTCNCKFVSCNSEEKKSELRDESRNNLFSFLFIGGNGLP